MHNQATVETVARLVLCYRARGMHPNEWPDYGVEESKMSTLVSCNYERFIVSLSLAREAYKWMHSPIAPIAAAAYLLMCNGSDLEELQRFLAPDFASTEPSEPCGALQTRSIKYERDDPRLALRRVMLNAAAQQSPMADHEALAYTLKAWQLWATGADVRALTWKPDDGMPRLARWLSDIPRD